MLRNMRDHRLRVRSAFAVWLLLATVCAGAVRVDAPDPRARHPVVLASTLDAVPDRRSHHSHFMFWDDGSGAGTPVHGMVGWIVGLTAVFVSLLVAVLVLRRVRRAKRPTDTNGRATLWWALAGGLVVVAAVVVGITFGM